MPIWLSSPLGHLSIDLKAIRFLWETRSSSDRTVQHDKERQITAMMQTTEPSTEAVQNVTLPGMQACRP